MSARDLSALNREELATFLNSFDTVLTDCDGVLWTSSSIPGSVDTINKLKELGKKVIFVSNNALLTVDQYVSKLNNMGYSVHREEIIIPSVVVASYLKNRGFSKKAFVLGSKAFKHILETEGIQCSTSNTEVMDETIVGFIKQLESLDTDVGAVILDFDPNLNYLKLMQAITFLKRNNCIFIVGATDHNVPLTPEITLLGHTECHEHYRIRCIVIGGAEFALELLTTGPGYFVSLFQNITGEKPIIAGKPSALVKEVISQRHPINPGRTLMIGDSIPQDICLGKQSGFQTLLVLSGISTLKDVTQDLNNQPNYYLKSLGDLLPLLSHL